MVAVAAICAKAPASTQGQNAAGGFGKGSPRTISTPVRNSSANGKPNRKRTCVAPTVPRVAVSSRCMALRAVCAAAAISVKTAQSIALVRAVRSGGCGPDFGGFRKFGHSSLLIVDQQEQVEIAHSRRTTGALDYRLPPFFVVRFLRCFDRRPDIDAGACLTVEFKQKVFSQ